MGIGHTEISYDIRPVSFFLLGHLLRVSFPRNLPDPLFVLVVTNGVNSFRNSFFVEEEFGLIDFGNRKFLIVVKIFFNLEVITNAAINGYADLRNGV